MNSETSKKSRLVFLLVPMLVLLVLFVQQSVVFLSYLKQSPLQARAVAAGLGGNVCFTDLSTNIPTGWFWDFGDSNTSSQQNPCHTYTADGTYTVSLIQ